MGLQRLPSQGLHKRPWTPVRQQLTGGRRGQGQRLKRSSITTQPLPLLQTRLQRTGIPAQTEGRQAASPPVAIDRLGLRHRQLSPKAGPPSPFPHQTRPDLQRLAIPGQLRADQPGRRQASIKDVERGVLPLRGQKPPLLLVLPQQRPMGEGHQGLGRKLIIHLELNHGAKPARQRMRLGGIQQTRRILKLCQPIGTAPRTRHQIALLRPINQGILATETHQAGDGEVGVLGLQGSHQAVQPLQISRNVEPLLQCLRRRGEQGHAIAKVSDLVLQHRISQLVLVLELRHIQGPLQCTAA